MIMPINVQLKEYLDEGVIIRKELSKEIPALINLGEELCLRFKNNNKILLCGNGGSAADCQHIAAEYINKFTIKRTKSLPAIALTTDTSILTAIGNDISFDHIFSKQIESLGNPKDTLFCFSTSGSSINVINAARLACQQKMTIVSFIGNKASELENYSDWIFRIDSTKTAIIQEMHIMLNHMLCLIIDEMIGEN